MSTTPPLYSTQWALRPRCTQLNEYYAPFVLNSMSTSNLLYSTQVFKYFPVFTWGPEMISTPGQSMTWMCAQYRFLSLESQIPIRGCLVFVSCTLLSGRARCDRCGTLLCSTDCVRQCPSARFCAALPPSPTLFFRGITATVPCRSFQIWQFFPFGRLVTVYRVREVHRVLGQGDARFLFC
jgi:hypothetical protein